MRKQNHNFLLSVTGQFLWPGLLYVLFFVFVTDASAQQQPNTQSSTEHTPESRLQSNDSLVFEPLKKRMESSERFYSNVNSVSKKNFFTRQLYPLLFKMAPGCGIEAGAADSEPLPYYAEKGKVIRSVRIVKAAVFGSSVFDTTIRSGHWLDKTLNSIHFNTHDAVIRNYIQVKKGQRLNPILLADNERIIRQSSIFEDARFAVREVGDSDSVDVVLIVRDVFPVGFDLKIRNAASSAFRIYNRNILGFGQQLQQSFELNTRESPFLYMSEGAYKIRNIRHSFTDLDFKWNTRPGLRGMGLFLSRPFLSPETRFGGGVSLQKANYFTGSDEIGSENSDNTSYDAWAGYSTIINRYRSPSADRSVFAITARYFNQNFARSIPLLQDSSAPPVTINRYIAALSLIRNGYFRSNMIYGFGKTEDIPTGHLIQLTTGYETSIIFSGYYTGLRMLSGEKLNPGGFIYSWADAGGFWSEKHFTDGIFELGSEYISGLYNTGAYRFRSFGSLTYKTGINRSSGIYLPLNGNALTDTYNNFDARGYQRLAARFETVAFSPYYLLGFRFAAYAWIETALLAPAGEFIVMQKIYPALGLGIRIKNENLAFSTFQIGFTWYGRSDSSGRNFLIGFSNLPQVNLTKFSIQEPYFSEYR